MSSRAWHVKLPMGTHALSNEGVLVKNRICMQPMRGAEYALKRRVHLLSLGVRSVGNTIFLCFVFPSCSSKGVPNSTTLLSHMVCPKFSPSHLYNNMG
jgi:hypothetical protein